MNRMLLWATDYFTTQSGNNPLVCFSFLLGCRHVIKIPIGRVIIASLTFYVGVFIREELRSTYKGVDGRYYNFYP